MMTTSRVHSRSLLCHSQYWVSWTVNTPLLGVVSVCHSRANLPQERVDDDLRLEAAEPEALCVSLAGLEVRRTLWDANDAAAATSSGEELMMNDEEEGS